MFDLTALPRPTLDWTDPADFRQPHYQRDLDEGRAQKIAEKFTLPAFGVATVSKRADGGLYIIDAQHRSRAAILADVREVPTVVYTGLTPEQEASLFLILNDSKAVSAVSKFKASVYAGHEPETHVDKIIRGRGWKVDSGNYDGTISAPATLMKVYAGAGETSAKDGAKLLGVTLNIITNAWGYDSDGAKGNLLHGIARVLGRYQTAIDGETFVSKLKAQSPNELDGKIRDGAKAMEMRAADAAPWLLVNIYNERLKAKKLKAWDLDA